jgi:hypothetical protein
MNAKLKSSWYIAPSVRPGGTRIVRGLGTEDQSNSQATRRGFAAWSRKFASSGVGGEYANLSHLKPPAGQKHHKNALGAAWDRAAADRDAGNKGARRFRRYSIMRGFEGGQMRSAAACQNGFTNIFKKQYAVVNLGRLDKLEGDSFNPAAWLNWA